MPSVVEAEISQAIQENPVKRARDNRYFFSFSKQVH
jgi:hypothetical protein